MLAVIETHPVQYRAPVYRALQERLGVPVTVIYGSDFSIAGYRDAEFDAEVAWDTDLLGGYSARFLSRARPGEAAGIDRLPVAGLDAALRSVAPRAVLVVGYRPAFHRAGWRAAWRQRRPLLFRGETSDAANPRRGPAGWVRSAGLGLAYARLDACLWIGQHSRAHFERLGVAPDRLFFSPYCVDDAPFDTTEAARARLRPGTRRALGLADDEWLVVHAGKLSTRKGVDLIVPAVRAWRRAGAPRRVVVGTLGQGTLAAEMARQAGTAPEVPVRFIGFQNQRQLSRYYHAADLLVLPSRHSETWGLVVNEALHHGVPCVVSDRVGAAPDLVDDQTGAVFLAGQVDSFTRALRRVEPLIGRPRVREACRARVRPYSVLAAAQGIAEAYHAVEMPAVRLLIVGHDSPTHVGSHFRRAAEALGLAVEMCEAEEAYAGPLWRRRADWWLRGRRPARLEGFGRDVLRAVDRFEPSIVLSTGLAPLSAAVLETLGARKIARANFLTDDPWNPAHRAPWFFDALARYDHVFSPRHANLAELEKACGRPVHYLPFAYDPAVHFIEPPATEAEAARYGADVMLAGGADEDRIAVIDALVAAGLDVALYGGYWDSFPATKGHARGWLDAAGLRRATSAARVSLGLVRRANRDGHAMRSFEVPAMGGCLLAEATDDHRALFGADGDAVLYFTSPEDAATRTAALVADPVLRQRLARRAHARVTGGGHTYQDRLAALLARAPATHAEDRHRRPGPVSRV